MTVTSQAAVAMLLALLLFAHARADWVEITQLPRKIIRTHTTEPSLENRKDPTLFSTELSRGKHSNRIYINHSLDHWSTSKGVVHRVPNKGNVERVRLSTEEPARFTKYEITDLSGLPQYTKRNPFDTLGEKIPEFVTKEDSFEDDDDIEELHFVRKPPGEAWKQKTAVKDGANKRKTPVRRIDIETETSAEKMHKDENKKIPTESETKVNTMENVLKFVKVVTDTITKNTRKSFSSKLRYLEDLKDTITVNIEDRIEALFPDDARAEAARRRRGARAARGHVEFPSSEGALMTISFLTFAVYLIKLVLQVVQSYKNKTMMTPAVIAAVGRAAKAKRN